MEQSGTNSKEAQSFGNGNRNVLDLDCGGDYMDTWLPGLPKPCT